MSITKSETLPRLAKRTKDTKFDRIWKYYFVPGKRVALTDKELELKERWDHIWNLLCGEILTDRDAVLKHNETYSDLDLRTCYQDLKHAKQLFGDARHGTKAQKRAMANEWIVNLIRKANEAEDYKAAEKLILRYTRINGLDDDDKDILEKLLKNERPSAIVFTLDPEDLERHKKELEREEAIDIDHEEVE